ncbi:MAG TPA: MAPEG family protein [Reyranella sp.]|nr:MAPEG family protein [Reyranella sp.]
MKPELTYLLFSVVLTFVQVLVAAAAANQVVGLTTLAGNREDVPPMLGGFAGRAKRAHLNMLENMVLFSALVLIAVVANKTNATTALGAMIFFWARLAYAVIYLVGIPWLRTLAWFVSVIGMVMVAWPLCS